MLATLPRWFGGRFPSCRRVYCERNELTLAVRGGSSFAVSVGESPPGSPHTQNTHTYHKQNNTVTINTRLISPRCPRCTLRPCMLPHTNTTFTRHSFKPEYPSIFNSVQTCHPPRRPPPRYTPSLSPTHPVAVSSPVLRTTLISGYTYASGLGAWAYAFFVSFITLAVSLALNVLTAIFMTAFTATTNRAHKQVLGGGGGGGGGGGSLADKQRGYRL